MAGTNPAIINVTIAQALAAENLIESIKSTPMSLDSSVSVLHLLNWIKKVKVDFDRSVEAIKGDYVDDEAGLAEATEKLKQATVEFASQNRLNSKSLAGISVAPLYLKEIFFLFADLQSRKLPE